jgi:hypothetical protein
MPFIPKELLVMQRLTALLERIGAPDEINPGTQEPYEIDLRGKVFRGRMEFGTEVDPPFVAILESPTPFDSLFAAENDVKKKDSWRILVQGFCVDDKKNPSDPAYYLKAAITAQLSKVIAVDGQGLEAFPGDYFLGNLLTGMTISQGVVRPPEQKVSSHAFCYIPLILGLATDARNPYAANP